MSQYDREKWNARYSRCDAPPPLADWLLEWTSSLPQRGRVIDVAGGLGAAALWLARHGLAVTLADISHEALGRATRTAQASGSALQTQTIDLESEPFPPGPWDVVVQTNYLQRSLFSSIAASLAPGGWFLFSQPTRSNLLRHEKPPRGFLLEDGELPELVEPLGLNIVRYEEGWLDAGRHEARLVARRLDL